MADVNATVQNAAAECGVIKALIVLLFSLTLFILQDSIQ